METRRASISRNSQGLRELRGPATRQTAAHTGRRRRDSRTVLNPEGEASRSPGSSPLHTSTLLRLRREIILLRLRPAVLPAADITAVAALRMVEEAASAAAAVVVHRTAVVAAAVVGVAVAEVATSEPGLFFR